MKHRILFIKNIIGVILFAIMLLPVSCGGSQDNAVVSSDIPIDWGSVNQAIVTADISQYGYYIETDYKTTEQELNYVSLYNYDPDDLSAWKKTEYQLDISYGQNLKVNANELYDYTTIVVNLFQTNGDGYYSAVYTPEGILIEEGGDWFMADEKEEYLSKKLAQAQKIFGIA